jgi:hypothetical protein
VSKTYYRNNQTGQRAYVVMHNGQQMLMLDLPHGVLQRLDTSAWTLALESRPLTPADVARVAFAADRQLCRLLAIYQHVKDFKDLTGQQVVAFATLGPGKTAHPARIALWRAITDAMRGLSRDA